MIKHTQNNSSATVDELFDCVWPLCWVRAQRVNINYFEHYLDQKKQSLELFLQISQNLQKSTCLGVSFLIKLQARGLQLYSKLY